MLHFVTVIIFEVNISRLMVSKETVAITSIIMYSVHATCEGQVKITYIFNIFFLAVYALRSQCSHERFYIFHNLTLKKIAFYFTPNKIHDHRADKAAVDETGTSLK